MYRRGFTLIELLIVVGIIAILAGFILASYGPAKSQAQDARRISDIGQIQTALEGYFSDPINNNQYPPAIVQTTGSGSNKILNPCKANPSQGNNPVINGLGCLTLQSSNTTGGSYMSVVPTDPGTNASYDYYSCDSTSCVNPDTGAYYQTYCLGANLVNSSVKSNAEQSAQASCSGVTWCPWLSGYTGSFSGKHVDNYVVCRQ